MAIVGSSSNSTKQIDLLLRYRFKRQEELRAAGVQDLDTDQGIVRIDDLLRQEYKMSVLEELHELTTYAFERAEITGDQQGLEKQIAFYHVQAWYRLEVFASGVKRAEQGLLQKGCDLSDEYKEHIRRGTLPDF